MTTSMLDRFPRLTTLLLASIVLFGVLPMHVLAQAASSLDPAKIEAIRQNCTTSQIVLQALQKRDGVARINRGRDYDQLTQQIGALRSRFNYNKVSVPELDQAESNLLAAIDRFRTAYNRYYDDVANAISVDCRAKPADFYQSVVNARTDRADVGAEAGAIDQLMSTYRDALVRYQTQLGSPNGGTGQ